MDGEHQTTAATVEYGVSDCLTVGLRVPVFWRGGGFMDEIIDAFHEAGKGLGFLDNGRPAFELDRYRVEGRQPDGTPWSWTEKAGTGLGNIELHAQYAFYMPKHRRDWRAAVVGSHDAAHRHRSL